MKTPTRFAVLLALSATLTIPSFALAEGHGRGHGGGGGDRGQVRTRSEYNGSGRSFENRGNRGGYESRSRGWSQGGGQRGGMTGGAWRERSGTRSYSRDRANWNGGRGNGYRSDGGTRQRDVVGPDSRGSNGYRTYTRNHAYRGGSGSETRYRSGDRSGYQRYDGRGYRSYGGYGGSRSYSGYRGGYRSYGGSHFYYTRGFYRPHYRYCSDFSIGLTIGFTPLYGYGYYDPYCGISFGSLGAYYDHCMGYGHPEAILVMDRSLGAPVATCVYDDGNWVVDDCDGNDDGYDEGYDY